MIKKIRQFLVPPVFPDDEDKTNATRVLYTLLACMLAITAFDVLIVLLFAPQRVGAIIALSIYFSLILASYALAQRGRFRLASMLFVFGIWVVATLVVLLVGRMTTAFVSIHVAIAVIAGTLLGRRPAIGLAVLSGILGLGLAILENAGAPLIQYFPAVPLTSWFVWVFAFILALTALNLTLKSFAQALARARQSEARYHAVVDNQTEFIMRWKPDGTCTFVNEAYLRYFGLTYEQALSGGFVSLVAEQHRRAVEEKNARLISGIVSSETHEHQALLPNGAMAWQEWTDTVIRDEAGKLLEIQSVGRDITERKLAEDQLARYAESLEILSQTSQQILTTLEIDQIYQATHAAVQALMPCDSFVIALLDETNQEIEDAYLWDNGKRWIGQRYPMGQGLTDFVITSGKPLRVNNWTESHTLMTKTILFGDIGRNTNSVLAVPMFTAEGKCIGMISAQAYASGMYTAGHEQLLLTLTSQVAKALENARLFTKIQRELEMRKQAQLELENREKYFRALIENSSDGIVVISEQGRVLYQSPASFRILGFTLDELSSQEVFEFVHPDDRSTSVGLFTQLIEQPGKSVGTQVRYRHKDGTWHWVETVGTNLLADAVVHGIVVNFHDVTDRKQAENELQSAKNFLQSTLNALSAHIAIIDDSGSILTVNAAWQNFGKANDLKMIRDGIGSNYLAICDMAAAQGVEDAIQMAQNIRRIFAGEISEAHIEYPCHSPQENRWFIAHLTSFSEDGKTRLVVAHENITTSKLAENALRASEDRYRALFEESPISIWEEDFSGAKQYLDLLKAQGITDFEAYFDSRPDEIYTCASRIKILNVNQATLSMYGAESKEELLKGMEQFLTPEFSVNFVRELIGIAEGKTFIHWEGVDHTLQGEKFEVSLQWRVSPSHVHDYSKVIVSISDITERKQSEKKLQESEERYRRLFDRAREGIVISGPEGTFIAANPAGVQMLGFENLEDMLGKPALQLYAKPERRSELFAELQVLDYLENFEVELIKQDGSGDHIFILANGVLQRDERGQPLQTEVMFIDITERKRAEEQLRESETRFRSLIENSSDEVSIIDADGNLLYESPSSNPTLGFQPDEYRGRNLLQLVHPDDLAQVQKSLTELLKNPDWHPREQFRLRHHDGHWVWVEVVGTNLLNEPAVGGIVVNYHNITDRKNAEIALADSLLQYRILVESSHDGIVYNNVDGNIVSVNSKFAELFGFNNANEILESGITTFDLLAPEEMDTVQERSAPVFEGDQIRGTEMRVRRKNGSEFDAEFNTTLIRDDHGQPARMVTYVRDITERKKAEQALRVSQQQLQSILETVPDYVLQVERDGKIGFINHTYPGVTIEEVIGTDILNWIPPGYQQEFHALLTQVLDNGLPAEMETIGSGADEQPAWYHSRVGPILENGQVIALIMVGQDITRRKRAEQQLVKLNRLYATLSQINQMIVRVEDQADLLRSTCDILVEFGGFSFAWVGLLDETSGDVKPVAAHGLDLENWSFPIVNIHAGEYQHVLLATAIRMAKVMTTENLADDPNLVNFYDLIHQNDYRSAAAVPLSLNGRCIGVLSMVSVEASVFKDEREVELLEEMQLDISFALEKIQGESRRRRTESDLRQSEERFYKLFHSNPNAVTLSRFADRRIMEVNDAFTRYTGYAREEVLGRDTDELNLWANPQDRARYLALRETQKPIQDFEWQYRTKAGEIRYALMTAEAIAMQGEQFILTNSMDISERKQAEQALQTSERAYANLLKNISGAVYRCRNDKDWTVEFISEGCIALTGYRPEEIIESRVTSLGGLMHPDDAEPIWEKCQINLAAKKDCKNEYRIFQRNGEMRWVWDQAQGVYSDSGELIYIEGLLTDITVLKEAEEALRQSEARQTFLVRLSDTLRSLSSAEEIKAAVSRLLAGQLELQRVFFTEFEPNSEFAVQHQDYYTNGNLPTISGRYRIRDYGAFVNEGTWSGQPVIVSDTEALAVNLEFEPAQYRAIRVRAFVTTPLVINNQLLAAIGVTQLTPRVWTTQEITLIRETLERTWDAVQRGRAQVALQTAEQDYRSIFENAPVGIFQSTQAGRFEKVNSAMTRIYGYDSPEEMLESVTNIARQVHPNEASRQRFLELIHEQGAVVDFEALNLRKDGSLIWTTTNARAVKDETGQIVLYEGFTRDITGRKQAEEQIQKQLGSLEALHRIDMAITAGLEMNLSLGLLIDELLSILLVDAASILLFEPQLHTLHYAAGRGFQTNAIQHTRLPLGSGHAGRAAFERRSIHVYDLVNNLDELSRSSSLSAEQFKSYVAIPLIAKGQIRGVLEIFHRSFLDPNTEWIDFAETMASRAAIAIEDAQLVDELQRSNLELAMAYDATIEGWSRALDLRDRETEGHTQRVTAMTLELAQALKLSPRDVVQMRRGALLHDIGKMGVPDRILFKEGPLTDAEWDVMRRHPTLAYEMLLPIQYLRPALDIPYCHHEKWDGTGYPRGLKGEEIPLAARIFAIIDVWDALTSDRAYRKAWTKERTIEYIKEQSGKYFDPQVVDAFLTLIGQA